MKMHYNGVATEAGKNYMAEKDYYSLLGVNRKASEKEIKQAFRRLARKHHPDVNPSDKAAENKFKEISQARFSPTRKNERSTTSSETSGNMPTSLPRPVAASRHPSLIPILVIYLAVAPVAITMGLRVWTASLMSYCEVPGQELIPAAPPGGGRTWSSRLRLHWKRPSMEPAVFSASAPKSPVPPVAVTDGYRMLPAPPAAARVLPAE
jgi:hypothetical protein